MNPFEALGEGMERIGWWVLSVVYFVLCLVLGHKWETQETYYPGAGTHYEGDICARCWRMSYDKAETP